MSTRPAASSLRWGRIALGGLLAEVILILAVVPLRAAGSTEDVITVIAVAGSFLAFVPVAWWLSRALPRPVLHGVLMGAFAAVIYMALGWIGGLFVADLPPVPLIYYVGHLLKLAGGATGGWLAQRARAGA